MGGVGVVDGVCGGAVGGMNVVIVPGGGAVVPGGAVVEGAALKRK